MAFVNYAVNVNAPAGKGKRLSDLVTPQAAGVPDRASVADLTFQQLDLQADVFNATAIVVSTTPAGPGITLGPGGVGRLTLGPFGESPLRLADLYGSGLGVVRVTGVTGGIGDAALTAVEPPAAHHTTHETGGTDALTTLDAGVLQTGTLSAACLPLTVAQTDGPVTFASTIAERGRTVPVGEWQSVPFAPGNVFADAGGSWTATSDQVKAQRYARVGQALHYLVAVVGATVGGSPSALGVTLPAGLSVTTGFTTPCILTVGGVNQGGIAAAVAGYTQVALYRVDGSVFTAGPASVYFSITLEVNG